jgi:hypothetical protein
MWDKLKETGGCKKSVFAFIFRRVRKIAKDDYWLRHVCPLGTDRLPLDGFHEICYLSIFRKFVGKIHFNSDKYK